MARRRHPVPWWLRLSGLFLIAAGPSPAQEMPVAVPMQSAIIRRVFDYVKTLQQSDSRILVVYAEKASPLVEEITLAFRDAGLSPTPVEAADLGARVQGTDAVYILPGVDASEIRPLCVKHGVLSFSGVPELAQEGAVAIAIGVKDGGRPEILVNIEEVRAERHELSSELLQLARVIQ